MFIFICLFCNLFFLSLLSHTQTHTRSLARCFFIYCKATVIVTTKLEFTTNSTAKMFTFVNYQIFIVAILSYTHTLFYTQTLSNNLYLFHLHPLLFLNQLEFKWNSTKPPKSSLFSQKNKVSCFLPKRKEKEEYPYSNRHPSSIWPKKKSKWSSGNKIIVKNILYIEIWNYQGKNIIYIFLFCLTTLQIWHCDWEALKNKQTKRYYLFFREFVCVYVPPPPSVSVCVCVCVWLICLVGYKLYTEFNGSRPIFYFSVVVTSFGLFLFLTICEL